MSFQCFWSSVSRASLVCLDSLMRVNWKKTTPEKRFIRAKPTMQMNTTKKRNAGRLESFWGACDLFVVCGGSKSQHASSRENVCPKSSYFLLC